MAGVPDLYLGSETAHRGLEAGRHFDRDAVCAVGIFVSDGRCGGNLVDGLYGGGGRIYVWISCRLL